MSNPNNHNNNSWIYHERQFGQLCGQHALNNFVQGPTFTIIQLSEIAQQLDEIELNILLQSSNHNNNNNNNNENNHHHHPSRSHTNRYDPPGTISNSNSNSSTGNSNSNSSHHVDEAGNFSIEVLKAALIQNYNVNLVHYHSKIVQEYLHTHDITTIQGFICHKNDHWFCIRKLYHRYWNLNSTLDYPTVISHFTLAMEMEQYATQQGYTIFCILPPQTLPERSSSSSSSLLISDENGGRWYTMADLLSPSTNISTSSSTTTTTTNASNKIDPWEKLNGTGRRLDGQQSSNHPSSSSSQSYTTIDGLTDEEMLQLALQQSMEPPTAPIVTTMSSSSLLISTMVGPVPSEPDEHCNNCIKIQFRFPLPYNSRIIRRFYTTNTIADIYHYVYNEIATRNFECIVGYPPKNILLLYPNAISTTLQETNLANATIQVRSLS